MYAMQDVDAIGHMPSYITNYYRPSTQQTQAT